MAVKGVLGKLVRKSTNTRNTRGYLVCLVLVRLPLAFFQKRDWICTWGKKMVTPIIFFSS